MTTNAETAMIALKKLVDSMPLEMMNDPEIKKAIGMQMVYIINARARDIDAEQMKQMAIDDVFNRVKLTIEEKRAVGYAEITVPQNIASNLIERLSAQKYTVSFNGNQGQLIVRWF